MKLGVVEVVDISTISPHPRNYRNHDADLIRESLQAHGQTRSVVCQVSRRLVLAGNGVYAEMLGLGAKEIVVSWVDVDDVQALKILTMDNRSHDQGWSDDGQLATLLEDISEFGWNGSGYDADAFDDLMAKLGRAEQITVGEETSGSGQNGTPGVATGTCPTCGQALP
jgi:hypothetical protein